MYEFVVYMVGFARGKVALSVTGVPCWHGEVGRTHISSLPDERFADLALPHFAFAIGGVRKSICGRLVRDPGSSKKCETDILK